MNKNSVTPIVGQGRNTDRATLLDTRAWKTSHAGLLASKSPLHVVILRRPRCPRPRILVSSYHPSRHSMVSPRRAIDNSTLGLYRLAPALLAILGHGRVRSASKVWRIWDKGQEWAAGWLGSAAKERCDQKGPRSVSEATGARRCGQTEPRSIRSSNQ